MARSVGSSSTRPAHTYAIPRPCAVDAEPALYVHGLGGSSLNWTDLAGLLSYRLDGQAIDLPGFGRSDPAARYTIDALSHRVIRVDRAQLTVGRCT